MHVAPAESSTVVTPIKTGLPQLSSEDDVGEASVAVLIDHVQELESAAGGGDIELVVQRPHVIGRSARSRTVGRRQRKGAAHLQHHGD